jgi:hypothetical protein
MTATGKIRTIQVFRKLDNSYYWRIITSDNSIYVSETHYLDDEDAVEAAHSWIEKTTRKRLRTNWESWDGRMLTRSVSLCDRLS